MEKIDIKELEPEIGEKCLVYGTYDGEIDGSSYEKDWFFVEYQGDNYGVGIGGDCYSWWVLNIEKWIKLDL